MHSIVYILFVCTLFTGTVFTAAAQDNRTKPQANTAKTFNIFFRVVDAETGSQLGPLSATVTDNLNDTVAHTLDSLSDNYRLSIPHIRGNYRIWIEKEGYLPTLREIPVKGKRSESVFLPDIALSRQKTTQLDELTVTPTKIKMVMRGDTLVYDASAFELAEGSMLDALVAQLPGTELKNGEIKVNGKRVDALLVNGEDFFSGNPSVALQNLPAYTVRNIKVYDRYERDDYLKANRNIMHDEHIVMDVNLKKQYSYGWLANAEAGYGSKDRYLAKAFGLGYTERLRLAAFANFNNILDTQAVNTDGNWYGNDTRDGRLGHKEGGINYLYQNKRTKLFGNAYLYGQKPETITRTSEVSYFNQGDIYKRQYTYDSDRYFWLWTNHNFNWSGDNAYVEVKPDINYLHGNSAAVDRQATFNSDIYENYTGQSLDSLMAGSPAFARNLLTFTDRETKSRRNHFSAKVDAQTTVKIPGYLDMIMANASYALTRNHWKPQDLYARRIADPGAGDTPYRHILQSADNTTCQNQGSAQIAYVWTRTVARGERMHIFAVAPQAGIDWDRETTDKRLDRLREEGMDMGLPSFNEVMRDLPPDPLNTYESTYTTTQGMPEILLQYENYKGSVNGYSHLKLAATVRDRIRHDRIHYDRLSYNASDGRTANLPEAELEFRWESNDAVRNITASANYNFTQKVPNLLYRLDTENTANPLATYTNNPFLRRSCDHKGNAAMIWHHLRSGNTLLLNIDFLKRNNAIAWGRYYNAAQGTYICTPVNVNGNWNIDAKIDETIPFGPDRQFSLQSVTNAGYWHSADYLTQSDVLARSVVGNTLAGQKVSLEMTRNRCTYGVTAGVDWHHAVSGQKLFDNINALTWSARGKCVLNLPYSWQVASDIKLYMRRGYSDNTLNTTDWIWNASMSRTFLKGVLTAKLTAIDILGQVSKIRNNINAQGRTETWVNSVPRYVMLHLSYRFSKMPRK